MFERDIYGEPIPTDMCADSPEGVATWNTLARVSVEDGLAFFTDHDGTRIEAPVCDAGGRFYFQLIAIEIEEKPAPHARTLGDVGGLDMDDDFDRAMASLPVYAALLDKAKAALLANIDGPTIQARLRCSGTLVSLGRRELREELDESAWPQSISSPKAHSRRANLDRPNMRNEAGGNPLQLRARNLGVSEAEARMIATAKINERKFKERPKDLQPKRKGTT